MGADDGGRVPRTPLQQAPEPKGDGGTDVTVQASELDKAVPFSEGL